MILRSFAIGWFFFVISLGPSTELFYFSYDNRRDCVIEREMMLKGNAIYRSQATECEKK